MFFFGDNIPPNQKQYQSSAKKANYKRSYGFTEVNVGDLGTIHSQRMIDLENFFVKNKLVGG